MSNMKRMWEDYQEEPEKSLEDLMRSAGMTRETYDKIKAWIETQTEEKND